MKRDIDWRAVEQLGKVADLLVKALDDGCYGEPADEAQRLLVEVAKQHLANALRAMRMAMPRPSETVQAVRVCA